MQSHVFTNKIDNLYRLVKDIIKEKNVECLKYLEGYKTSTLLSLKENKLEEKHYYLFDQMSEKVAKMCLNGEMEDLSWLSTKDPVFLVSYINTVKQQTIKELSIDFSSLYSYMPGEYEKLLFIHYTLNILSLSTSNHKTRAVLEKYREHISDLIDEYEDEEEDENDEFSKFFDKTEKMLSDKKVIGNAMSKFANLYEKLKTSEVGEAINNSIPEGSEISQDTIKNTIMNVQSKLNNDSGNKTVLLEEKKQ